MSEYQFSSTGTVAAFGEKLASSQAFKTLFRDGMGIVEEVAAYLDGQGRADAKALDRGAALSYATESMRLTTRLMQLASWLLLQRAVNEGELTLEQAAQDKAKVRLSSLGAPTPVQTLAELPETLVELISKTMRLQDRIVRFDTMIYSRINETPVEVAPSDIPAEGLSAQLSRIEAAFTRH